MAHPPEGPEFESEVAGLRARSDALRQAATMPGAEPGTLLEAAFAELDGAVDVLTTLRRRSAGRPAERSGSEAQLAERRLLRAVFQDAPVPLFLLGRDATVHRVNISAGDLLGSRPGYATGKLFTAFVDLPSRAAVHSQIAAVARTGRTRKIRCRLLSPDGPLDSELTVALASLRGDADQLIVTVSANPVSGAASDQGDDDGNQVSEQPSGPREQESARLVEALTHRYDLATAATRLFLENASFSESVTLQRCARLLAAELAAWVIVDVERRQRLRRQFVMGPADQHSPDLARAVSAIDPQPGTAPRQVHESGSSLLIAHAEDAGILGAGPDGVPIMMLMGATSLLCVPLSDGERTYGALTLARHAREGHFDMADLGLVEELGEQLALAIRLDRMFRRHSEIADALQSSLLPRELPQVPGVELASAYVAATEGLDVGGDFYDVYRTPHGWGVAIGDVGGRGEEAAAVTAAARHAIRVLGYSNGDPAGVLAQANEIMLAEEYGDRFVTAKNAQLQWRDRILHVALGSAGHPGPILLRPDGRVQVLETGGLPLGLFPDAEPGTEEIDLEPGDVLFFFTDGVTAARSPEMAFFEDRLTEELAALAGQPPREIVTSVRSRVLEFAGNELRDDMTMLVLRVGQPPDR